MHANRTALVDRHLAACAAFTAAGVLLPALPAGADIIATTGFSVTAPAPAAAIHVDLVSSTYLYPGPFASPFPPYQVNLVAAASSSFIDYNATYYDVFVAGAYGTSYGYVFALSSGYSIDSSASWIGASVYPAPLAGTSLYYFGTTGPWASTTSAYVGLKVGLAGTGVYYYGWLAVTAGGGTDITLTGFALETTPGTAITAGAVPEPTSSSLALLAAGAGALGSWRRRRVGAASRAARGA